MTPLFKRSNVHSDDIHALVQKSDGEIISGSKDCTARVWSYSSERGIELKYFTFRPQGNYEKWVTAVHPFQDGSWGIGYRDGTLQFHGSDNKIIVKNSVPSGVPAILKKRNRDRVLFIQERSEAGSFYVGVPKLIGRCSLINRSIAFDEAAEVHANDWPYLARPLGEDRFLVAIGSDLEVWNGLEHESVLIREDLSERKGKLRPHISTLEKMKDPSQVALGTFRRGAHVFDLQHVKYVFRSTEHWNRVWSVLPLEDKIFASAGDNGFVKIWDIRQKKSAHTIDDHDGRVSGLLKLADKVMLAASCPDDPYCSTGKATFTIWDLREFSGH